MRKMVLVIAFLVMLSPTARAEEDDLRHAYTKIPISRSFMGFTLGESKSDVAARKDLKRAVRKQEPAGEAYIFWREKENDPDIAIHFMDGILYWIRATFRAPYTDQVSWSWFVGIAKEKYGRPPLPNRDSPTWVDRDTWLFLKNIDSPIRAYQADYLDRKTFEKKRRYPSRLSSPSTEILS